MSTTNKIDKRATIAKGRRREALAFFQAQCSLPGFAGIAARAVYNDLLKIHRDPARNGPEKELAYRRIIQAAGAAGRTAGAAAAGTGLDTGAAAGEPRQPEPDPVGDLPASAGVPPQ